MGNRSVNSFGVVLFLERKRCPHRRLYHATRDGSNFGYLIVEMMHVWDLRVQSRLNLGESKSQMRIDAVINLMNPETLTNHPHQSKHLRNERKEWKPRIPAISV
jgi:uncharacterized protein (UPF0371 family)